MRDFAARCELQLGRGKSRAPREGIVEDQCGQKHTNPHSQSLRTNLACFVVEFCFGYTRNVSGVRFGGQGDGLVACALRRGRWGPSARG